MVSHCYYYRCFDARRQLAPHMGEAMPTRLGEKMRYLRQQHGWSQRDLTRQLQLARHSYISNLEAGRKAPSLQLVIRLAHVAAVSIDYLLRDTIPPEAPAVPPYQCDSAHDHLQSLMDNLRVLRKQHRLTQGELGERLGIAKQSQLSHIEVGIAGPSLDLVLAIADVFEVTVDDLLCGEIGAVGE
jgi:transcriptional regulator with XRE-family HTH domain